MVIIVDVDANVVYEVEKDVLLVVEGDDLDVEVLLFEVVDSVDSRVYMCILLL